MENNLEFIAFDADDTLWENENHYQAFEDKFCSLLDSFATKQEISRELFNTEMKNLPVYGYGVKAMMLSMIETLCKITREKGTLTQISEVLVLGRELLQKPVQLLDGAEEVLARLSTKYKLVLATKGDLLDQQRKIEGSGLKKYFNHIEIMSDKTTADYDKLLKTLSCRPGQFLMTGNSVKSDIQPVLELGGRAVHIPYHITWQHEQHVTGINHSDYRQIDNLKELLPLLLQQQADDM